MSEFSFARTQSAQVGLKDLAGSLSTMAVSNIPSNAKKSFCKDVQLSYFLYNYVKDGHNYCLVDFLVMPMPKEMLCPKVAPGGMVLQLGIMVPPRFVMDLCNPMKGIAPAITQLKEA